LSPESRNLFDKQLGKINFVQRFDDDKEINLYQKKLFKIIFEDSIRFPAARDETKLAKVYISHLTPKDDKTGKIICEVWIVNGRLFSMTFNKSPKILNNISYEINSVKVLVDPMKTESRIVVQNIDEYILNWVNNLSSNLIIKNVFNPAEKNKVESVKNDYDCTFPSDWLELISHCDGLELNSIVINGFYSLREVKTNKNEYIVLVEGLGSKILAIKKFELNSDIYLIDTAMDDEELISFGHSFIPALKKYVNLMSK
jgi:hypothetical protein